MDAAAETQLTVVEVEGLLPGASNATLLARDGSGRRWVYKPVRGEQPLWDFAPGTLAAREVAGYRLSAALGLDVVPETLLAEGIFGPGSAQAFLEEDRGWDPRPLIVGADPLLWPVAVFDLLANNADRKVGHLLRQPGRPRVWAIDNGLTFHADAKLRTVLWAFAGAPLPDALVARLDAEVAVAAVAGLLDGAEVEALGRRVDEIRRHPVHPPPPDDRPPLPWPIW